MTHKIAILGASGYTGAELVRLIATHPSMEIVALSADRKAGQEMSDVYPHLRHLDLPKLVKMDEIDFSNVDLAFAALPHGLSQALVRDLPENVKVVDLARISVCAIRPSTKNGTARRMWRSSCRRRLFTV